MKVPFIIYADVESLLEKMNTCHNNPKKSSTTKIDKHTASGYSLITHCSFDTTKNKLDYYRGKNCTKNFCLDLKEHATKLKIHQKQKICYICKKGFSTDDDNKKYHKVRDHYTVTICHYTGKYRELLIILAV